MDYPTTTIEAVVAPADYEKTDYQFFKDDAGALWKASVTLKTAREPMLGQADVEAAPSELAVAVTVSPVDADGKALRENDKPIIVDTHTHTFTNVEMQEPDFDPSERIMRIVAERVHAGKARVTGVEAIRALTDRWSKKAKIPNGKFTYQQFPESRVLPGVVEVRGQAPEEAATAPPEGGSAPEA